jgi:PAS domain S-box-containing protein
MGAVIPADAPVLLIGVVSAAVLLSVIVSAIVIGVSRRRRREAQELVLLLEEMRSGRVRKRLDLDSRSPFAAIAESANRLGQDLGIRWSRAEAASEGFLALQAAARGYAVIATDADGDIRSLSPTAVPLFGWEEDAVVGRNASLLFDESSWKELLPKLARKSLRERGVDTRAVMARHDGTKFPARLHIRVLRGHGEDAAGFLVVVQDVTEQVRVETDLRGAERRARSILDGLPGGVALVERGALVFANPAMRSLLSIAEMEVAGFPLHTRIATTSVLVVQDALMRIASGRETSTTEANVTLVDASGRPGPEVRFVGVASTNDGRPAVLILFRDVTLERRLVRTLGAEKARLDAVLDAWRDAVAVVEDEGAGPRVRVANRAFVDLFGLARADVSGVTEAELVARLRRGSEGNAAADALAEADAGPAERAVDGEARALELRALPLARAGGGVALKMLVVRDVTHERRQLRAQADDAALWRARHEDAVASQATLQALHDELAAKRDEADSLNSELKTLDSMKSDLLANVSHELQTPLVSIRGYTEMILKGRLGAINDEQKKGLTLALKNIDRLIAMIDNLLAFARSDRETGSLALTSFPLDGLLDEALALLSPRVDEKSLRVTRQIDDGALRIRADRDKILQVFLNVLGNAVKFNKDRGSIDVAVRRGKPGFAVVQVADTGVGIPKEDLEKVFDRFYRAGEAGARNEGSGIGLSIVRNILRLHGCVIQASSEPGEGTVLSFTLPLAGEDAGTPRVVSPVDAPSIATEPILPPAPRREAAPRADAGRPRLRIIRRR